MPPAIIAPTFNKLRPNLNWTTKIWILITAPIIPTNNATDGKNHNNKEIKNFHKVINRISEVAKKYEFFKKGAVIMTTKKIK